MFRDPDLPRGFQDADFEMRSLEAAGQRASEARKNGQCDHGWKQIGNGTNGITVGFGKCLHCGKYSTEEELDEDYREVHR